MEGANMRDENGNGSGERRTIRIRPVWLDGRVRRDDADEVRDVSALSADADGTPENLDESAGSVGAESDFDPESGGSVGAGDQPDEAGDDPDSDIDSHPRHPERDGRGRFNGRRPGPGRPRGCSNHKTLRALELRQRIVDSWDRVNGDRLLDQLAKADPAEYLKLVCKLLPAERPDRQRVELRKLVFNVAPIGALPPRKPQLPPVDPVDG